MLRIGPCVRETSARWERKLIPLTLCRGESLGVKEETYLNREGEATQDLSFLFGQGGGGSRGMVGLIRFEDKLYILTR